MVDKNNIVTTHRKQCFSSGSAFEEAVGYSRTVAVGDQIWVSGTTGFDYGSMTISDSIEEQTEQCFRNIEAALATADATLDDIVRALFILPDGDLFSKTWPILKKNLGNATPTSTMIQAGLADPRMKIEIEVQAVRGCGSTNP